MHGRKVFRDENAEQIANKNDAANRGKARGLRSCR
jgi:hypothetical protein